MANRVKLTTLVDVDLKSGKVDSKPLRQELPKLLEQAMATLPGAKSIISPDILVDPKFNISKVQKELSSLLEDTKFSKSISDPGFKALEKDVLKYSSALEKLANVQTTFKSSAPLLKNIEALREGEKRFSEFTPRMQNRIKGFQNYLAELTRTWKGIQADFGKVTSTVRDPEIERSLKNAQARLSRAQKTLDKARLLEAEAVKRGANVGSLGASTNVAEEKVAKERAEVSRLKDALSGSARTVGATVEPELKRLTESMSALGQDLKKQIKADADLRKKEEKQLKRDKNRAQTVDTFSSVPIKKQSDRELRDYVKLLNADKADLLKKATEEGADVKSVPKYQAINKELDAVTAELQQRRRDLAEHNKKAKITEEEARRIRKLEARDERTARANELRRGRLVNASYPNVYKTPEQDIEARKAYLQTAKTFSERSRDRVAQDFGVDSSQYEKATQKVKQHSEALFQLGHAGKFTHPILSQLGRLMVQFARYGLGYAALYKFTGAIRALGSAVIGLEDDLKSLQAITGSTNEDMVAMAATVKQVANSTSFGLDDIAQAVKTVAQAGTDLRDIPSTVQAVANLATATGTTLQTAADVITTAQGVWDDLDPVTISDRVTQAANISKLAVEDLKTIFNLGATFFKAGNLNLDQALGVISTLRNTGIKPSTIGTGSRQLLLELGAPDKKFTEFLVRQYESIGEKLTSDQASRRFENYKLTDSPLISALNEMKRIGANSESAMSALQRSIDRRAFNVLSPLLRNTAQVEEQTARFSFAPTAREAAEVAMDSLKKASENLVDSFQSLTATASKDLLPALADLTRGVTEHVHFIDKILSVVNRNGGLDFKLSGAGALAGAAYGFKTGHGLGKLGKSVAYGTLGGLGTLGADAYAKSAKSDISTGEVIFDAVAVGAILKAAYSSIKKVITKKLAKASAVAVGPAVQKVIGARLSQFAASSLIPAIGGVIAGIGALFSAKDIYDLVSGTTKKEAKLKTADRLKALYDAQAERASQFTNQQQDFIPFAAPEPGQPLDPSTVSGAFAINNQDLNDLREKVSLAIGKQLTEDANFQVLELVEQIRKNGANKGQTRDNLTLNLTKVLEGSKEITEEALQPLLVLSGKVSGSFRAQIDLLADTYAKLVSSEIEEGSIQDYQLSALKAIRDSGEEYRDLLVARTANEKTITQAMRRYLEGIQGSSAKIQSEQDLALREVEEWLRQAVILDPVDTEALDKVSIAISNKLREGVEKFGIQFISAADQLVNRVGEAPNAPGKYFKIIRGKKGDTSVLKAGQERQSPAQRFLTATELDLSRRTQARNSADLEGLVDKLGRFLTIAGEDLKKNPDANLQALFNKADEAFPKVIDSLVSARGLSARLNDKNVLDNFTQIKQDQEKADKRIGSLSDNRELTKAENGAIKLGSALSAITAYLADADRVKPKVVQDFVGSRRYLDNKAAIRRAEEEAAKLERENPKDLLGDNSPLRAIRDKKIANLQEEINHIAVQPFKDDTNKRERLIQELQQKQEDAASEYVKAVDKFSREVAATAARLDLKKVEERLKKAIDTRNQFSQVGRLNAVDQINSEIEGILKEKAKLEAEVLKHTKAQKDQAEALADVEARRLKQKQDILGLEAKIKALNEGLRFIRDLPIPRGKGLEEDYFERGVDSVAGTGRTNRGEAARLTREVTFLNEAIRRLNEDRQTVANNLAKPNGGGSAETFEAELTKVNQEIYKFQEQLGVATQKLGDLAPTLLNEIEQISINSISAKVSDLPQSLKNFNRNFEQRTVDAVDSFAGAVASSTLSFVDSLFGLEEATKEATTSLSNLYEAQGNLALIEQNRINLADEITNIRRNEVDPARQEILIQQALDAQSRAEDIANIQVAEARRQYENELESSNGSGFFSKIGDIGRELYTGVATDYIKGAVFDSFSSIFGDNRLGATKDNPTYVSVVNGDETLFSAPDTAPSLSSSKSSGGILSKVGSWVSDGYSSLFGSSGADQSNPSLEVDKVADGVTEAMESPWYDGLTSDMGGKFDYLVDGLGEEFSSFTTALGVMLGMNWKAPGYQPDETLSMIQGIAGIVGTVAGGLSKLDSTPTYTPTNLENAGYHLSTGGAVVGPGTSTSDSIPAALSNGEYVLNARAAKLIGKDVLDQWNFHLKTPARMSTGGMVGSFKKAVSQVAKTTSAGSSVRDNVSDNSSVRVVLVDDQRRVSDYLGTPAGEKTLLDFVRKNSSAVKNFLR